MYYQLFELNHAFISPARVFNDAVRLYYKNPLNPFSYTGLGRQIAAAGDLFERMTRRYGKPAFGITATTVNGRTCGVSEEVVWSRPFCRLLHFRRDLPADAPRQPKLVIVAPMSGHYATLLRGTVQALLPDHDLYITDWIDARMVPVAMGRFDLDDYIDYLIDITRHFRGDVHMVAVCQPAVPVFAATALMEAEGNLRPKSITLMGGPIDTRQNPTGVNTYAEKHELDWFRRNVIHTVPFPYPAVTRQVYPGFLQLSGFMTMNLDRHMSAHYDYFDDLVKGDGDSTDKHREFYDEYLSVMDLTAEFYLQTVNTVFLTHALPRGEMVHRDRRVDPSQIRRTPILTVEGEKDDISGIGQTRSAHRLTPDLPAAMHGHYEQAGVGHYGVFNGSRFRREIAPRIRAWTARWDDDEVRNAAASGRAGTAVGDGAAERAAAGGAAGWAAGADGAAGAAGWAAGKAELVTGADGATGRAAGAAEPVAGADGATGRAAGAAERAAGAAGVLVRTTGADGVAGCAFGADGASERVAAADGVAGQAAGGDGAAARAAGANGADGAAQSRGDAGDLTRSLADAPVRTPSQKTGGDARG